MRWEGRRQSSNVEDRRGMRVSRGGLVGGGLGTLAIALIVMFLGGDPTPVLQGAANAPGADDAPSRTSNRPRRASGAQFVATMLAETEDVWTRSLPTWAALTRTHAGPVPRGGRDRVAALPIPASVPFYCPADENLFLDMAFFDELEAKLQAGGDFAHAYVIAHEVGHHVQNLLGISDRVHEMRQRVGEVEANQLSVRLELQADCFAGLLGEPRREVRGILEPGDIDEGDDRRASRSATIVCSAAPARASCPDSFTHGTSEQRQRWFQPRIRERLVRSLRHLQGRRPLTGYCASRSAGVRGQAVVKAADYQRDVRGIDARSRRLLGAESRSASTGSRPHAHQGRLLRSGGLPHPLVRGRRAQRLASTASTASSRTRGDKTALLFEGDDPAVVAPHQLPRAARARSAASATRCAGSA